MYAIAVTPLARIAAISLAIVLAIIGQTQCFTLRYEYVRPQDMMAEESSISEVRHDMKRDIEHDEYHVAPITAAMPLTMTTEGSTITVDNEIGINNAMNDSLKVVETTVIPKTSEANVEGAKDNFLVNVEAITTPVSEIVNIENTTDLITQETSTVMTTFGVTDDVNFTSLIVNYVEESITEMLNKSEDTNDTISTTISDQPTPTTTESLTVGGILNITTQHPLNSSVETTPAWKKYAKIERKPVNVSEEVIPLGTERVRDSVNAHSIVSLEKAFDLAPDIQSLQELKNHLMDSTNSIPTTDVPKSSDVTIDDTKSVVPMPKKGYDATQINSTEMVSLRAGYLNHTKPLPDAVISTTMNASAVLLAANEIELGGVAYEMDTHEETEEVHNKKSHSQMVEDALKEELLREAYLGDTVFYNSPKTVKANAKLNEITLSPTDKQSEDLTVRPINYDKKNTLYTVNPNYKPLKKIEVTPSKPFMRDPDDNTWRNESLSSLGIVFKGKNSSKVFTEVLKNKTETVMSSPEQGKVLEKVELRDRLEKIAEKRKRKKKIDRYGNTEYGDYEENSSAGDVHSSKEKNSGPPEIVTTTPMPFATKEGVPKVPVIEAALDAELNKNTRIDKPKIHTDYYEGKDEDVDYVTFPNFDILKSTPRPRVQWPVTQKILDNTQPIKPHLPDRQPTVQYFPPLPKALSDTNNNYREENFNHKFAILGSTRPQNEKFDLYTERPDKVNPGGYVTDEFSPDASKQTDRPRPVENIPIQHVEYKPVGSTDDGSFAIRHYKDLLESVIKDTDYDRNGPYAPTLPHDEGKTVKSEEYDYGQRKEGLNRFVDYFNQNHERFKADFPVLFNTSIVHGSESGKVLASSSAMFKRLYNGVQSSQKESFAFSNKPFDPHCENITVELSPAYELHYYLPEQEETGDHTLSYGYRS